MKSRKEYARVARTAPKALWGLETQIENTKTGDTNGQSYDNNFQSGATGSTVRQ